jgi:hypothetical protein
MIVQESDLYRIIGAITMPSTMMAPIRTYCMNCKTTSTAVTTTRHNTSMSKLIPAALVPTTTTTNKASSGVTTTMVHCRHCSRSVCTNCCKVRVPVDYFGKNFRIIDPSTVSLSRNVTSTGSSTPQQLWPCCVVCEKVLTSRREIMSNGTQPTTATSYGSNNGGINDFLFDSYDNDDTDRYSC